MTINELITPELKQWWCSQESFWTEEPHDPTPYAAVRDLLAALLESEFKREHVVKEHDSPITGKYLMCGICPMGLDQRHLSTWPDWQAEATKILEAK